MHSYFKKLVRVRVPSLLLLFKSFLRTILFFFLDRGTSHDQINFLRSLRAAAWVEAALSAPMQLAGRARPHRRGPHCSAKPVCAVPQGRHLPLEIAGQSVILYSSDLWQTQVTVPWEFDSWRFILCLSISIPIQISSSLWHFLLGSLWHSQLLIFLQPWPLSKGWRLNPPYFTEQPWEGRQWITWGTCLLDDSADSGLGGAVLSRVTGACRVYHLTSCLHRICPLPCSCSPWALPLSYTFCFWLPSLYFLSSSVDVPQDFLFRPFSLMGQWLAWFEALPPGSLWSGFSLSSQICFWLPVGAILSDEGRSAIHHSPAQFLSSPFHLHLCVVDPSLTSCPPRSLAGICEPCAMFLTSILSLLSLFSFHSSQSPSPSCGMELWSWSSLT